MGLDVERPINHRDIQRRMTAQDRANTSSSSCIETYELKLMWNPTAATITIQVKYKGVTEGIVITRGMDAAAVQAEFNTHSKFVEFSTGVSVGGTGYLWNSNMVLWMPEGATIESFSAVMTTREYSPTAEFYINICRCRGTGGTL